MGIKEDIAAAPSDKARTALKARAGVAAFASYSSGYSVTKSSRRLVFDQLPSPVTGKQGELVGVEVMVRLFEGATEVRIDPHRVIINPPTVPRTNLTWEERSIGTDGNFVGSGRIVAQKLATAGVAYRRIVGMPDPEAALIEALWDSIDQTPNPTGWRTRGTVDTIYATAPGGNGTVRSNHTTYATARTGANLTVQPDHRVGQFYFDPTSYCLESFIIFDTSSIVDDATVSAVTLSLDGSSDLSTTDFIAGVAASSYDGGAVITTDWVSGASIPTPELATWNSSGYSADYNDFTETADFKTAISLTGNTSLILYSQRHRDATAPAGDEWCVFLDADAGGTTTDPKLAITYTAPTPSWLVVTRRTLTGVGS